MKKILNHLTTDWYKYLLELIVITAGVLGAFALNAWKEERKQGIFEQEVLNQILVNLKEDQANLQGIVVDFEAAIASSKKILSFNEQENDRDSLQYWLGDIIQFSRFQPLTNSYELLKSRGLDNLSNKELAFMLGKYYDDVSYKTGQSIRDIEISFNNDWIPLLKEEVVAVKWQEKVEINNWDILVSKNGQARILVILNKDNYQGGLYRIKKALLSIEQLIQILELETKAFE